MIKQINRKKFTDGIRPLFPGGFKQITVDGLDGSLDYFDRLLREQPGQTDLRHIAYFYATVHHETGRRMYPVRETFAISDEQAMARLERAWQNGQLPWVKTPYWRDGYFGRGPVQITHKYNYDKQSKKHGLPISQNTDLMLQHDPSNMVAYQGMIDGDFRAGHSLPRYFSATIDDPFNAREIINADKNRTVGGRKLGHIIADYHKVYLASLQGAIEDAPEVPPVEPPPVAETVTMTVPKALAPELIRQLEAQL